MGPLTTAVFFYGLFMDDALLAAKGFRGKGSRPGVVRDWALRIGRRATMLPTAGETVHGIITSMAVTDVERLYAEDSVRMYRPVAVLVEAEAAVAAIAYVLPEPPAADERNPEYAAKLRSLCGRLGFPEDYIMRIGY